MKIQFKFSPDGSTNKQACLDLLEQSTQIGYDYKADLRSSINGADIGFHRYHQIYDTIVFLNEYKFPRIYLKVILVRGQTDLEFQKKFNYLLCHWMQLLVSVQTRTFEKSYSNELKKIKEALDNNAKKNNKNNNNKPALGGLML